MPWTKVGNIKGPGSLVDLGQITIARTATLALSVGVRAQTFAVPGVQKDERILLSPLAPVPAGYLVGQPTATAADTVSVPVYEPAMILNASYSFKARVLAIR